MDKYHRGAVYEHVAPTRDGQSNKYAVHNGVALLAVSADDYSMVTSDNTDVRAKAKSI